MTNDAASKSVHFAQQEKRRFGDFDVDCVSRQDLVDWCLADIEAKTAQSKIVMDVNGHGLSLARQEESYRAHIGQADIIHADGGFLVTLSKKL